MSPRTQWLMLASLLVLTISGFALVYKLRLSHGDSFPPYSSWRADPLGTRALHDSLAALPELQVSRTFEPLSRSPMETAGALFIVGSNHRAWTNYDEERQGAIERAARSGSRVIVAMKAYQERDNAGAKFKRDQDDSKTEEEADSAKVEKAKKKVKLAVPLKDRWDVEVQTRWLIHDVTRETHAPNDLPETLPWGSEVILRPSSDSPWRVVYRRGEEPVLIERTWGKGSVVMIADAYMLSNEALQLDRSAALIAWLVGPHATIVFDESHLGLAEQRGIAFLARKYGLAGAFAALLAAAGLFVWNRMALFVPSVAERADVALSYNQTAGLEALLRRALAPGELAAASVEEWRKTARISDIARVEAALLAVPKGASPIFTYNSIVKALRRR